MSILKDDKLFLRFCFYGFLKNLRFFEPFFFVWLLGKDFSYLQIGAVYSVRELSRNLLEIPSGFAADEFGKKKSLLFSYILYIGSFLTYYFSNQYAMIITGALLYGIADSFRTGTHKALIFTHLRNQQKEHLTVEYYGTTRSYSMTGSAVSALLAALIVMFTNNFELVFLLSVIPYLIGLTLILTYPDSIDQVEITNDKKLFKRFKQSFKEYFIIIRHAKVLKTFYMSASIAGLYMVGRDYVQPVIKNAPAFFSVNGLSVEQVQSLTIGLVYFVIYMVNARASVLAKKLKKRTKNLEQAMHVTYFIAALLVLLTGIMYLSGNKSVAIAALLCLMLVHNLRKPITVAAITEYSKKNVTASLLSTDSQLTSLVAAISALVLGYVADLYSIGHAFVLLGVVYMVVGGVARK